MQQSELFLCSLCATSKTERTVPGRGIPVLLLPCCIELDHREVQMNQVLQALVLLLMQGWCSVALVCLCLDAALESFSPGLRPSASHTAGPTSAPSRLPLWSEAKSLWTPLTSRTCATASQRRMGHRNPGTVLGSTPLKGKNISSDEWQDREAAEMSSSMLAGFLCLFNTEPDFRKNTGGWLDSIEDGKHSQAGVFNSPDPLYALWAHLRAVLCAALTQRKRWDHNAPAAPLSWVFSVFGLFRHHYILHEPDSDGDFTALW